MANELYVSVEFKLDYNEVHIHEKHFFLDTFTGPNAFKNVQTVGQAAEEAILLGDVSSGGMVLAINTHATNYVLIRPATGEGDLIRINAGQFAVFRLGAAAPLAQADTTDVEMIFILLDA